MSIIIITMVFVRRYKRGAYTYLAEVESYRENGKIKQRFVKYIGREVDGKTVLSCSVSEAEITGVKIYGPLLILNEIARRFNLSRLLGLYGEELLSLAYAHCVEPNSLKKIVEWYQRTDINCLLELDNVTYQTLLDALDSVKGLNAQVVQENIFKSVRDELGLEPKGLFYDITNAYFYGVCCPLAKKGQNSDGVSRPQIQIALAVTKAEGLPVFHRVFAGNIFDSRTLPDILVDLKNLRITDSTLVWDRGTTSKINVKAAKEAGFEVICGMALKGNVKDIAMQTVQGGKIAIAQNRVRLRSTTFYAKKIPYKHGDNSGWLAVCFNEKQKQETKERRYDEIDAAIGQITKKEPVKKKGILKYLDGTKIRYARVKEAEKYDGISAIFSTKNLPTQEIIKAYFEKDRIEKAFRCMKSVLETDKIRFWLSERVEAHIFVCYIAYLLLSLLEYLLKKRTDTSDLSATAALDLMKDMYRVHLQDPKTKTEIVKTVAFTRRQEDILRAVNKKLLKCSEQKTS